MDVIDRQAPGISQAMMFHSLSVTPKAMLRPWHCRHRGHTLIINLPGSPKAVRENLEYILEPLKHGLEILKGEARRMWRQYPVNALLFFGRCIRIHIHQYVYVPVPKSEAV